MAHLASVFLFSIGYSQHSPHYKHITAYACNLLTWHGTVLHPTGVTASWRGTYTAGLTENSGDIYVAALVTGNYIDAVVGDFYSGAQLRFFARGAKRCYHSPPMTGTST